MTKKRKIDWNKIKLAYMSSDDSVNAVLDRDKVTRGRHVSRQTKGWVEERKKLHQRILEKIKTQIVNTNVKQWESQTKLWKAVEGQAAQILKRHIETDKPLKPQELASLTVAIEKALKGQKLIIGEPTETIEQRSLHLQLIQISKRIEHGDDLKEIPFEIGEDSNTIQNKGQE